MLIGNLSFAEDTITAMAKDARRVETFSVFPGSADKLCNGKVAMYQPKYSITLVVPKAEEAVSLDDAATMHKEFVANARTYLQNSFFYDLGDFDETLKENTDIDTKTGALLPLVDNELAKFLAGVRVSPVRSYDKSHLQRDFMFIYDSRNKTMAMAAKVAKVYTVIDGKPAFENKYLSAPPAHVMFNRVFFEVSTKSGARDDSGHVFQPLILAKTDDFASLVQANTFTKDNGDQIPPRQSINSRNLLWKQYVIDHTLLEEAPQADGTIKFLIRLDMNGFCKDGVALASLKAS